MAVGVRADDRPTELSAWWWHRFSDRIEASSASTCLGNATALPRRLWDYPCTSFDAIVGRFVHCFYVMPRNFRLVQNIKARAENIGLLKTRWK